MADAIRLSQQHSCSFDHLIGDGEQLVMSDKGFLPPWCRSVYPMVNLMRRGQQVFGDDLNCSESRCALPILAGALLDHQVEFVSLAIWLSSAVCRDSGPRGRFACV